MRRNTGTVLGLPIPDEPVDINAPRPSRKRHTNDDGSGHEESPNSSSNAPPNKIAKTSSSAGQGVAPALANPVKSTHPNQPLESVPVEGPPKRDRGKKKKPKTAPTEAGTTAGPTPEETTNNTAPAEQTPAPAAIPKKQKGKKAAPPPPDNDVEMGVPTPTATTQPGSISISDSIVPPSPAKKKSRKRKGASATASGVDMPTPTDPTAGADPTKPVAQGGKSTGRTKTPSALAQQLLTQENNKVLEREAKAQRKKERAQKAVIQESPADTAAFLARTEASGSTPPTDNNIEIRPAKLPVKTGGLQRARQSEANKLIAQRATQRLLSSAPSSSGSEFRGVTSSTRGRSVSRASSLAPPPSVSSSRAVSVAPSTSSAPAFGSYSDISRALSSHPSTRPASPRSEIVAYGAMPVLSSGPTLAECYEGIPEEFAPRLPAYEPLPPPLREPERRRPVPYKDLSQLSMIERKAYTKACKLGVKDLTPNDHIIVSSVLSRLDALINTIDCFPSDEDAWHLMLVANAWGCRKHNLGNLLLVQGSPYEELLANRVSQTKTGIVEFATGAVTEAYNLRTLDLNPDVLAYNKATVKYWLQDGNFTCPPTDFGALYERSTIKDMIKSSFFLKTISIGVVHRDLFGTITIPLMAGVAAALEKALLEYETGVCVKQQFSRTSFRPKWSSHVVSLCDMFKSPEGHRLVKHLRDLSTQFLAPFPAMSGSMTTVIAPRIPAVANRYGRSVAAPPPPTPPAPGAESWSSAPPLTSAPTPVSNQPGNHKQKIRPKMRTAGTEPALLPKPAPPTASETPVGDDSETESESESLTESETESEPDEGPLADAGDTAAWAESVKTQSTSAAQFDALHAMVGGKSSEGEDAAIPTPVVPPGDDTARDSGSSDTEDSDESTGEGGSGAGELVAKSKEDIKMRGPDGESSGTEAESSGDES